MKKRILLPTLLIGALLTASLAIAGPGGCDTCGKGGGCQGKGQAQGNMNDDQQEERSDKRLEMMSMVLDLTDEQQSQLKDLTDQQWQDKQQLREKMQASREAMRQVQSAATFDEAEFLAKAIKQAELKTEMMAAKAKMKQQIYALLTPAQQEKADKLNQMRGDRGKGQHAGPGFGF
jgi:protein CpxP